MSGFVYLKRNKDLYKIGISQNLEQRMKALNPDEIIKTVKTENYKQLEKRNNQLRSHDNHPLYLLYEEYLDQIETMSYLFY